MQWYHKNHFVFSHRNSRFFLFRNCDEIPCFYSHVPVSVELGALRPMLSLFLHRPNKKSEKFFLVFIWHVSAFKIKNVFERFKLQNAGIYIMGKRITLL